MVDTGIVRRVDSLGRVVLPKEMRILLGFKEGTPVKFSVEGEGIYLQKDETKTNLLMKVKNIEFTIKGKLLDMEPEKTNKILQHIDSIKELLQQERR